MSKEIFCPKCGKSDFVKRQKGGLIKTYCCENQNCKIYFKFGDLSDFNNTRIIKMGPPTMAGITMPPTEIKVNQFVPPAESKTRLIDIKGNSEAVLKLMSDDSMRAIFLNNLNKQFFDKGVGGKFNIDNGVFDIEE